MAASVRFIRAFYPGTVRYAARRMGKTPCNVSGNAVDVGVLRLRVNSASRDSHSAQDDSRKEAIGVEEVKVCGRSRSRTLYDLDCFIPEECHSHWLAAIWILQRSRTVVA